MCYILKYDWSIQSHPVPDNSTNQPMRYTYLTPSRLQSGFPRSAGHLDWQMPSMQDSHSLQTLAGSHTLQKGRSIIHLMDLAPEPEYIVYETALMLVSVPDPKPTPARIAFSIARIQLEVIYAPDEVWGRDYSHV